MPRERVLTESDGAFAQIDGEAFKPWAVKRAIHELGVIWSLPPDEVEQNPDRNLKSLLDRYDR
jgi:TatD DNase family protein